MPFENIYEEVFKDRIINTALSIPYFHLTLEGYDPQNYDIKIATMDKEPITQQLNKTENGYALSFRPSKNNFNAKEGVRGLQLMI